jgi:hypothetical protein
MIYGGHQLTSAQQGTAERSKSASMDDEVTTNSCRLRFEDTVTVSQTKQMFDATCT